MNMLSCAPQVGDILWAFLPEEGSATKAKERPVIVLDVSEQNGLPYLTVAKGTSKKTEVVYMGEFVVNKPQDLASCGLTLATKFQLRRYETLPFSSDWFNTQKPIVNIPKHLIKQLIRAAQEAGHI